MLVSAKILLILASYLVAHSQGNQDPEGSTFKSIEVSSDSSTLTSKEIDIDSSEESSDSTEASTQLDIFSGTEETEVAKSNEILSGDLVSEVYIVPSSSATPPTESILFLDVPWDETSASSDHKRTTALPRLNETSVGISPGDSTETSTEFNIPSGTEDNEMAKSSEIQSGDLSSETYSPSLSLKAFALLTEAPIVPSTEDSTETSNELDISSGTEESEGPKSSEIPSGDMGSEIDMVLPSSVIHTTESVLFPDVPMDEIHASSDHKRTTTLQRLTEAPIEISPEDPIETSTEFDISSGTEEFEGSKSSEIPSGDMSSEIDMVPSSVIPTTDSALFLDVPMDDILDSPDHKRTRTLRRLTEAPVEISIEDPIETSTEFDISSGTEEFDGPKSSEIPSGDMGSGIDMVPPSSVIPTTESVLFPDVLMDEIHASSDHKRTTTLQRLTEAPVEISPEDPIEASTEFDISSGTEEFEGSKSSEIPSGDMSSEIDMVPPSSVIPTTDSALFLDVLMDDILDSPDHKRTRALRRLTEAPVEISIEDPIETSTEFDISSGTEEFEGPKSSEIPSGDMSSERDMVLPSSATSTTESVLFPDVPMDEILASPDRKLTTALPKLTEAPIEVSIEDPTETTNKIDISSEIEEVKVPTSSEILSGDRTSEIDIIPSTSATLTTESVLFPNVPMDDIFDSPDHKRTTTPPKLTEIPIEISIEEPTETTNKVDIFSETEEVKVPTSSEILSVDRTSEIDILPTPTTKSVLFPLVPMDEIPDSPDHKRTTESVNPKDISTSPASSQNPTTIMPMDFILPSITSTEFIDSNDSVKLPEEQVSDASNTSKLVSNTAAKEKKTSVGILFGVLLGSVVGAALLATVAFLLYRKRKPNLFAHQRFFDERNEPVHRLDNTTDTHNLSFGGTSFFNSAVPDDPVMEKNTERAGENIQMKTIPTAFTLNKPWGIGLQNTESHFMPRTVSNP